MTSLKVLSLGRFNPILFWGKKKEKKKKLSDFIFGLTRWKFLREDIKYWIIIIGKHIRFNFCFKAII